MEKLTFVCPCHFGLEKILTFEIKKIGGEDIVVTDGRVVFSGGNELIARANINLSVAERVGILLGQFPARTFDEVFDNIYRLPLDEFIGKNNAFPVKGHAVNSTLNSIPALQSVVKKAVAKKLGEKYGMNQLPETGTEIKLQFSLIKDQMSLILDTTGQGLHKRGYRRDSMEAPIKETLAAGIVDIARVREGDVVCDPLCGSGTILIEAAYKALNIAPGLARRFSAMYHPYMDRELWNVEKESALSRVKKSGEFTGFGYDIDRDAIKLAIMNAKKAGVVGRIRFEPRDIADFTYFDDKTFKIITNPPYGERLLEVEQAKKISAEIGRKLFPLNQHSLYIITADGDFEDIVGQKADKNRKLYNGMIQCRLYQYFGGK